MCQTPLCFNLAALHLFVSFVTKYLCDEFIESSISIRTVLKQAYILYYSSSVPNINSHFSLWKSHYPPQVICPSAAPRGETSTPSLEVSVVPSEARCFPQEWFCALLYGDKLWAEVHHLLSHIHRPSPPHARVCVCVCVCISVCVVGNAPLTTHCKSIWMSSEMKQDDPSPSSPPSPPPTHPHSQLHFDSYS